MSEMAKPIKCPQCGARTSRTHTGVVYLKGRLNRGCNINHSNNNAGYICVQCGYFKIKYKGRQNKNESR